MDWTYSQKNIVKYVQIYKELMSFWEEKIQIMLQSSLRRFSKGSEKISKKF